jgi:hypothetical protein
MTRLEYKRKINMARLEQLYKSKQRRSVDGAPSSTFPEEYRSRRTQGGDPDTTDEILESIDRVLEESTVRSLGVIGIEGA